jgi:hypothetical protein
MRRLRLSLLMHGVKFSLPERVTTSPSVLVSLLLVRVYALSVNSNRSRKVQSPDWSSNVAPVRVLLLTRLMPNHGNMPACLV